jgi:hypothetical protein
MQLRALARTEGGQSLRTIAMRKKVGIGRGGRTGKPGRGCVSSTTDGGDGGGDDETALVDKK